jgi:hypothetical protein
MVELGSILAGIKANAPIVLQTALRVVGVRLLGKMLEFPEVWIDGKIQVIRDKIAARTIISQALASEAAKVAIGNAKFLEAAVDIVLSDYSDKILNRAAVYQGALQVVGEASSDDQAAAQIPDDDWMNAFVRYAEDASSDRMRETFSRILAGEILVKGTFSRTAVRLMYELTPEVAEAVSTVWNRSFDGVAARNFEDNDFEKAILISREAGFLYTEPFILEDKRIEESDDDHVYSVMKIGENPCLHVKYKKEKNEIDIIIPSHLNIEIFTKVGKELASILPLPDVLANLRSLVDLLPHKEAITQMHVLHSDGTKEAVELPTIPLAKSSTPV